MITLPLIWLLMGFWAVHGQLVREYFFDESQKKQLLESHNTLRSLEPASNMQELVWDDRLAKTALAHARNCDVWHSKPETRLHKFYDWIGENIWWSNDKTLRKNLRSAMLEFYDEKKFYFFGQNVCAKGKMCLHYTQFVWATTCAVGCAATQCSSIKHGRHISHGHVIVCHYGEGGNEYGNRPYLPGPKCSNCPIGSRCNSKGLCSSTCTSLPSPFQLKFASTTTGSPPPTTTATSHPLATSPPSSDCRDRRSVCVHWAKTGNCHGAQRKFMAQFCASSCGLCDSEVTTEAPKTQNVTIADDGDGKCRDRLSKKRCERDRAVGRCRNPRTMTAMKENCKVTCGFCESALSCRDMYRTVECSLLKERGQVAVRAFCILLNFQAVICISTFSTVFILAQINKLTPRILTISLTIALFGRSVCGFVKALLNIYEAPHTHYAESLFEAVNESFYSAVMMATFLALIERITVLFGQSWVLRSIPVTVLSTFCTASPLLVAVYVRYRRVDLEFPKNAALPYVLIALAILSIVLSVQLDQKKRKLLKLSERQVSLRFDLADTVRNTQPVLATTVLLTVILTIQHVVGAVAPHFSETENILFALYTNFFPLVFVYRCPSVLKHFPSLRKWVIRNSKAKLHPAYRCDSVWVVGIGESYARKPTTTT
ncbi:hypothetical protein QR680_018024 [Steinernema hermaphroditum]|uniref:ShKT domain-containing protein n=1 Tax=Steinernema hermaphroditum TaxID=289476 RepID=A0AA39LQ33_9BILA|nr:hypothetical protein QR680_018024 [Steinernema hermaphroditum]